MAQEKLSNAISIPLGIALLASGIILVAASVALFSGQVTMGKKG